jgi:hypothetical protein
MKARLGDLPLGIEVTRKPSLTSSCKLRVHSKPWPGEEIGQQPFTKGDIKGRVPRSPDRFRQVFHVNLLSYQRV